MKNLKAKLNKLKRDLKLKQVAYFMVTRKKAELGCEIMDLQTEIMNLNDKIIGVLK